MRFFYILLTLLLSLTLTGCGLQDLLGNKKKTSSPKTSDSKQVIGVALNDEDPNKILIQKGIEDMAKKENMEVKYLSASAAQSQGAGNNQQSKGSSGQSSGSKSNAKSKSGSNESSQSSNQNDDPLQGAKVLIYQGGKSQNLLQAASQSKVPILTIGQVPSGVKPVGVVLSNPESVGQLMAESALAKMQEGQLIFLQADPNDSASQSLVAGAKAVLSKNPKINLVVIGSPPGSESVARQSFIDYLQKNPGKVQGVLAQTEKLSAQASEVLKQMQLADKVFLVNGQANIQSLQRMASGGQIADVDTSPYLLGVNAYQWAQKIVKNEPLDITSSIPSDGGEIPAKILPVKPVTPENIALVQKSYVTTLNAAAQEQAAGQQQDQSGKQGQQGQGQANQGQSQGSQNASGQSAQGGQNQSQSGGQQPSTGLPAGVQKVTERVRTETTREYLDAQGKVIGTEKNANEQVRTIPPEMLLQNQPSASQKQSQTSGQDGKNGDKEQGDQKDKKNGGENGGNNSPG
ncbi:substrate-binding domain-containing protein [Paradesulfitobacterium ferrireducens]|uniref:substrate-binding domain-containing protein n=1 Tax=Paradesulfitobacterium ferrireducens TaxID=2816476 RepID=UPI001A8DB91A|nr:substrate-binding domain-containing protein [Paradesulfitobacterium ferrireducens]